MMLINVMPIIFAGVAPATSIKDLGITWQSMHPYSILNDAALVDSIGATTMRAPNNALTVATAPCGNS